MSLKPNLANKTLCFSAACAVSSAAQKMSPFFLYVLTFGRRRLSLRSCKTEKLLVEYDWHHT